MVIRVGVLAFWGARALLIDLFLPRYRRWRCRLGNLGLLLGRGFENQVSEVFLFYMVLARDEGEEADNGRGDGGW